MAVFFQKYLPKGYPGVFVGNRFRAAPQKFRRKKPRGTPSFKFCLILAPSTCRWAIHLRATRGGYQSRLRDKRSSALFCKCCSLGALQLEALRGRRAARCCPPDRHPRCRRAEDEGGSQNGDDHAPPASLAKSLPTHAAEACSDSSCMGYWFLPPNTSRLPLLSCCEAAAVAVGRYNPHLLQMRCARLLGELQHQAPAHAME